MIKKLSKMLFGLLVGVIMMTAGARVAHAQVYIYANDGSYFHPDPSQGQYWYIVNDIGYCGDYGSCSPHNMRYTWSTCPTDYTAVWDNDDINAWGIHDVFIPWNHATSYAAPYILTYYQWWTYAWDINQYSYSDEWVRTTPDDPYWLQIRNTWLDDGSCEGASRKIGYDEIKITY